MTDYYSKTYANPFGYSKLHRLACLYFKLCDETILFSQLEMLFLISVIAVSYERSVFFCFVLFLALVMLHARLIVRQLTLTYLHIFVSLAC